jgi:FkbH-like protein
VTESIDVPLDWDDVDYLDRNPDVKRAVTAKQFLDGLDHYRRYGRSEGRLPGRRRPDGQTPAAALTITSAILIGTRWVFGHINEQLADALRFSPSGAIENHDDPNESTWRLSQGVLEICGQNGQLTWISEQAYLGLDGRKYITLKAPHAPYLGFMLYEYKAPPRAADFLFPSELRVTPTGLKRILLIGSCLSEEYARELPQHRLPGVTIDHILFNNVADLPPNPPAPIDTYDFQYIQIPLRSVLGDHIVNADRLKDPAAARQTLSDGMSAIDVILESAMAYNRASSILSLVSNFFVPQMSAAPSLAARHGAVDLTLIVRRLNEHLAEAVDRYANAYVADVDAVACSIGKKHVLDDVVCFYAHASVLGQLGSDMIWPPRTEPIPPLIEFHPLKRREFFESVYEQMVWLYRSVRQIDHVKAVIFDLDNTLWRGQIAEHYRPEQYRPQTDGWPIGLWETIHHLRARGILLAICSKNDQSVVERYWSDAVSPEFFGLKDFASVKINWLPKEQNVRAICDEFNIKPKSVVFVDDNPVERAAVQASLPGIRVIGSNPYLTRRILLWAPETQIATLTEESSRREEMIRGQIVREEARAATTRDQFLATLGSTLQFMEISSTEHPGFPRALELINRTNQFNTTGKRWSHSEMNRFLSTGGVLLSFSVADKFADYGLVGVLLIEGSSIVQFVMSCRVLGMEIEMAAVAKAISLIRKRNGGAVDAQLVETQDNMPCRDVYERCGFRAPAVSESCRRFHLASDAEVQIPAHIQIRC